MKDKYTSNGDTFIVFVGIALFSAAYWCVTNFDVLVKIKTVLAAIGIHAE